MKGFKQKQCNSHSKDSGLSGRVILYEKHFSLEKHATHWHHHRIELVGDLEMIFSCGKEEASVVHILVGCQKALPCGR